MKRRKNWILHRRRHYLLWNGKGVTTDQFNWKVVFWLRWILQYYSPTAKEKGIHSQSKTKLTYHFMLKMKRCWSSATKGLAGYCKTETTFTFHFSILTFSNAFLGIDNGETKSESGFSFAIASQPLGIRMSEFSISVEVHQKFVFKFLLKGTQWSFRKLNKLRSRQYFVVS